MGVRPTQLTIKQPAFQKFRPDYDLFQNLQKCEGVKSPLSSFCCSARAKRRLDPLTAMNRIIARIRQILWNDLNRLQGSKI